MDNATAITFQYGGNVGIGTISPDTALTLQFNKSTRFAGQSIYDSQAFNVSNQGGTISFGGRWTSGGSITEWAAVGGIKSNTTDGDYAGDLTFYTRPNASGMIERMRITSGGQVQIKQGSDGYVDGLRLINTLNNRWTFVNGGDNTLYLGYNEADRGNFNTSTGVYTATSDVNKKKDFEQSTIGLSAILGLKPTLYRMKNEDESTEKHLGFIAQEVKDYIPQAYTKNINGDTTFIGLNFNPIVAALVKAIQELKAELDTAKTEINELKNK